MGTEPTVPDPRPADRREALIERVRAALDDAVPAAERREVAMFGGLAFMVDDRMVVSVGKAGDLLVRADPSEHAALTSRPGAATAEMGTGRTMGEGWIDVSADRVADDAGLDEWLGVALDFHRS